jgi:signal peptidase complex subunit 3
MLVLGLKKIKATPSTMKTILSRISAIMSCTFNCTSVLLLSIALTTRFYEQDTPKARLNILGYGQTNGLSHVRFNPGVDLSGEFHPNLKQIFFYLRVVYGKELENSEICWSKIVRRNEPASFSDVLTNNYNFSRALVGDKVIFELRGCYFPYVGTIKDKAYGVVVLN